MRSNEAPFTVGFVNQEIGMHRRGKKKRKGRTDGEKGSRRDPQNRDVGKTI